VYVCDIVALLLIELDGVTVVEGVVDAERELVELPLRLTEALALLVSELDTLRLPLYVALRLPLADTLEGAQVRVR